MVTTIQKWGNGNGVRIPKSILDELHLSTHDQVDMQVTGDCLTITKVKHHHKTYEERMSAFYGVPMEQIERIQQDEVDSGSAMGEEIW